MEDHQGWALAYARAILGSDDDADAVQDAFVRAYRSLSDLEVGRPFRPSFRAILRNRCLDELGSAREKRVALVLREMEGMSYDEMADELEVSVGTVSSRPNHARRELRRVLEDRGFTAGELAP